MDEARLFGYRVMVGNPLQKTKKMILPVIGATKTKKQKKDFFCRIKNEGTVVK